MRIAEWTFFEQPPPLKSGVLGTILYVIPNFLVSVQKCLADSND